MTSPQSLSALAAEDRIHVSVDLSHRLVPVSTPLSQRKATFEHLASVYRRAQLVSRRRSGDTRTLLVASLIHEMRGVALHRAAYRLADRSTADAACAIVEGFGTIWKLEAAAGAADLARCMGSNLRLYLLFELAHEGSTPPFFCEAWAAGHLGPPPSGAAAIGFYRRTALFSVR